MKTKYILLFCFASTQVIAAASDFTGTYQFTEKGFSGTMKVSEISECGIAPKKLGCLSSKIIVAEIVSMHKTSGNDCDIDLIENKTARVSSGAKTEATFTAKDKSDSDVGYEIVFSQSGARVKSGNGGCGVQGTVLGAWKKTTR